MSNLLCGVIPWFGGHPDNLRRTADSMRQVCDEVLVVHQSIFDEDREVARSIADKVEIVNWNYVFGPEGYGGLPNKHGQSYCDWMLLFGVGETLAEQYKDIRETLRNSPRNTIWRCNHVNDVNTWGRLWCPSSGVHWSGVMHEEAGNGSQGSVIFRMQDTEKTPMGDTLKNETLRYTKALSYHWQYSRLRADNALLGFANRGWISFVNGAMESNLEFLKQHEDLLTPAITGDREAYLNAIRQRIEKQKQASGVNMAPLGQPMTEGA